MIHHTHDPILVVLSILLAIFASYTALDLANSVTVARGKARLVWLLGGSMAMGVGIWSMHFIAMLAFSLPGIRIAYDVLLLILSVLVAIVASAIALFIVSRAKVTTLAYVLGGLTMGAAISGMHYIGIAGMRMAARWEWIHILVAASMLIAVIASFIALFIAFRLRGDLSRQGFWYRGSSGVIMGLAIAGMHYTGMAAMVFYPAEPITLQAEQLLATPGLAVAVSGTTLLILGIALTGSAVGRALARKQAITEQITASEARFRAIFASASIGMAQCDPRTGRFLDANQKMAEITGYSVDELRSLKFSDLTHSDDRVQSVEGFNALVRGDIPVYQTEKRYVRKDGQVIWIAIEVSISEKEPNGKPGRTIAVIRDITDTKKALERVAERTVELQQLNEELRSSEEHLQKANRMKDEFLAVLSHELRTPLTSIYGWINLLQAGGLDQSKTAKALEVIDRNVRAQTQLIDDLLNVSRIVTGNLKIRPEWIEAGTAIRAAVEAIRPAAAAKGVQVSIEIANPAEPLFADSERLQQVLWNLLMNAVKFTDNGGDMKVECGRVGTKLQISVSDTGEGIDPEFIPFVFERFTQADASTTRKHGGLGLGLSIVKHIVESHGGTVMVHSEGKGHGTTFIVQLPIPAERSSDAAKAVKEPVSIEGLRVMLVEDEPDTRETVAALLERYGASVRLAGSAAEALEALAEERPDVLVSDIGMPIMDGYELIEKIRSDDTSRAQHIPAVALTAFASEHDKEKSLHAGYQAHLSKPLAINELIGIIATVAKGGRSK